MSQPKRLVRPKALVAAVGTIAAAALVLTGCSAGSSSSDKVTITLAGPNQFTDQTNTFGPAWDKLIKQFEKDNPNITIKTNVLPLSSFGTTLTTQLTAGTAPELIFNQPTPKPSQVTNLDSYLAKKNPFDPKSKTWLDAFDSKFFGDAQRDGTGHHTWVPFNLVAVGIFYNNDILKKEGISPSQLTTFDGFTKACTTLKKDGINPLATDNGILASGWATTAIQSTMLDQLADKINVFGADGKAGTSNPVAVKSVVKGILDGSVDVSKDPAIADSVRIIKKWYDACATPNWSGITSAGAFTGSTAFPGGKAAMAWGTDFSAAGLSTVKFKWSTVPFPTISKKDSKYASGAAASFGTAAGGTSYEIPAYIKGAKLKAAITFLQYVSSPKIENWLSETGSIPAITSAKAPTTIKALTSAAWSTPAKLGVLLTPAAQTGQNLLTGYLIGSKTLDQYLTAQQAANVSYANEQVTNNKWTDLG